MVGAGEESGGSLTLGRNLIKLPFWKSACFFWKLELTLLLYFSAVCVFFFFFLFFWLLLMLLLLRAHDSERHGWTPVPRSSAVKVRRSARAALKLKSENKQTRGGKKKKRREEGRNEGSGERRELETYSFQKDSLTCLGSVWYETDARNVQCFFLLLLLFCFYLSLQFFLMTMWKSNDDDFCLMLPIDWSLKKT